ncbi:MAG: portal protein [Methylomonas sp.]|jgi:hypothetical protein
MADLELCPYNRRWQALKTERSTWWQHWADISRFLLPRSGRYFASDRNKGWPRNNAIYDSTATRALRILAAGMMSGMTSPSRPWFRLAVADPALMGDQEVKIWLNRVTEQVQDVLARSNAYRVLHMLYEELGAFGTGAALIADDFQNVIHLYPFTIGEYAIGTDWKGDVVTLYREFDKTVAEVVREFGVDKVSPAVKNLYQLRNHDAWVTIRHAVEPRSDRESGRMDALNMPFRSVYWEAASNGKVLRESGFAAFPCVAPRWATQGGDIYGNSPGMEALGDIKQLQAQQLRKSQAIDYQANPPLQLPTSMKNRENQLFPGGISYYDAATAAQGVKTAFEVNLNLQYLLADIQDVRGRINSAFYADLFMMISEQTQSMTATEVAERHEEKMLMLGPVVERLNNELLDPLLENAFARLLKAGLLPRPPAALQGHNLNIEYVSLLAQAQKAVALNSIDRFVGNLGQIAAVKPEILDKFNADHWADIYSDKLSIDPELVIAGPQLALIRNQRAQQAQLAQQQAALQQGGETLKDLGDASTQPGTAAGDLLNAARNYRN